MATDSLNPQELTAKLQETRISSPPLKKKELPSKQTSFISQLISSNTALEPLLKALTTELENLSPNDTNSFFDDIVSVRSTFKVNRNFLSQTTSSLPQEGNKTSDTGPSDQYEQELLLAFISFKPTNRLAFANYISGQETRLHLGKLYSHLQKTSDLKFTALMATYPIVSTKAQRELLEISVDTIKIINNNHGGVSPVAAAAAKAAASKPSSAVTADSESKQEKSDKKKPSNKYEDRVQITASLQLISRYFVHSASIVHGGIDGNNGGHKSLLPTKEEEIKYIQSQRQKILSIIAPYADRRAPQCWVSPVVMTIAKLVEIDFEGSKSDLCALIDDLLLLSTGGSGQNQSDSTSKSPVLPSNYTDINLLIISLSLASLLFHISVDIGYLIFSSETMMSLQRLFITNASSSLAASEQVVLSALDLLSAACVQKEARVVVKTEFLDMVKYALEFSEKQSVTVLAASILAKATYAPGAVTDQARKQQKSKSTTFDSKPNNGDGDNKDDVDLKQISLIFEDILAEPLSLSENGKTGSGLAGVLLNWESNDEEIITKRYMYSTALEGLAFTSLISDIKLRIMSKITILENLVTVISKYTREIPWVYCALSVFVNVTTYAPKLSAEQKRLNKLKQYSEGAKLAAENSDEKGPNTNSQPSFEDDPKESDQMVAARCKKVLSSTKLVTELTISTPHFTIVCKDATAKILRNLATEKSTRSTFVQFGGVSILLYLLLPIEPGKNISVEEDSENEMRGIVNWSNYRVGPRDLVIATSALARILISVDPKLALSTKVSPAIVVRPLLRQLTNSGLVGNAPVMDRPTGPEGVLGSLSSLPDSGYSDLPLLDVFEALLALTNVAADDETSRALIVRLGWQRIEILLTSSNDLVQRGAVELVCNLASSPYCAEKFFDIEKSKGQCLSRLELLAALTDVDDLPARSAALGAVALLLGWGSIASDVIAKSTKLVTRLFDIVGEETNAGILIRALSALETLISEASSRRESVKDLQVVFTRAKSELLPMLKTVSKRCQDGDVNELVEIISSILV